jgi:hypothetical protein
MARRNGIFSIREVARNMCRLITFFEPVLRAQYPNNTALQAALSAAMAACGVLDAELQKVQTQGD